MKPLTKLRQGEFVVVEICTFIGSCTGGKLLDLTGAAEVLKGRHVAPGVDMFVVPASFEVRQKAEQLGYVNYP